MPTDQTMTKLSISARLSGHCGKRENTISVCTTFVKDIPHAYTKEVVEELGKRIEKEIDGVSDEIKIEIKPYGS